MCSTYMFIFMQIKLIFLWKVLLKVLFVKGFVVLWKVKLTTTYVKVLLHHKISLKMICGSVNPSSPFSELKWRGKLSLHFLVKDNFHIYILWGKNII